MKLARARRTGTLEEIRSWILESRSPGSTVVLSGRYFVLVAPDHGRVAAIGLSRLNWWMTEVKHLVVLPEERRKGYGRTALALALEKVSTPLAVATVREENLPSLALFRGAGFEEALSFEGRGGPVRILVRKTPARAAEAPPAPPDLPVRSD